MKKHVLKTYDGAALAVASYTETVDGLPWTVYLVRQRTETHFKTLNEARAWASEHASPRARDPFPAGAAARWTVAES